MLYESIAGTERLASLLLGEDREPNLWGGKNLMDLAHMTRIGNMVVVSSDFAARLLRR